jgi:hypothetical protein
MDWEAWLRSAARPPSDTEDARRDRTEQQIRKALTGYEPLRGKYKTFVKGSYANRTNVRLNYDVDIAVEYLGYFYYDLVLALNGHDKSEVGLVDSTEPYSRADFKRDINSALTAEFGQSAVKAGRIAYRVREGKTTLPADVVPSWEYRRYDGMDTSGQPIVQIGSRVYPSDGGYVNNFPKLQEINGTAKNDRTRRRYKRMVRCLKKMQTRLVDAETLESELPSYLVECLVYNVPDYCFSDESYLENFRAVVRYIWRATQPDGDWNDWEEVHGLRYLFRGDPSWTREQVHTLADKAWDEVGIS